MPTRWGRARLATLEDKVARIAAVQQRQRKRFVAADKRLATVEERLAALTTRVDEAHRLAIEDARAIEGILIDVNTIRRDLDKTMSAE